MAVTDWNPAAYAAFRSLRLRPALDLLAQVPDLPPGDVVDLGCGDGAAAAALAARFPGRRLVGVDASPAMLDKAGGYASKVRADIAAWQPEGPPALIFSNAALHWLPDHATLFPRLVLALAPGERWPCRCPRTSGNPRIAFCAIWRKRCSPTGLTTPGISRPPPLRLSISTFCRRWVRCPFGKPRTTSIWPPRRRATPSAPSRPQPRCGPFLDRMSPEEAVRFTARYDDALAQAYPLREDGSALFPFRRLFLTLTRPA